MRVLIIGSGGREHALAWKLKQSPLVSEILAAPGNGGTASPAVNIPLEAGNVAGLTAFALSRKIDLVVPGPELPLTLGIADAMSEAGIACFGPGAACARLEGSKSFAKSVMLAAGVPTAKAGVFSREEEALAFARGLGPPVVIKADGLAAGKGVIIAGNDEELREALADMLRRGRFGEAGRSVVVEECLRGEEVSLLCFCDGEKALPLPSAQDHKRVFDGDRGPNTGGMGAYSPAPALPDGELEAMADLTVRPVLAEMARRGTPYRGILYAGLMLTRNGPYVLEYNVRFGDPECQPLLMRLESDLAELMTACIAGRLDGQTLRIRREAALGVVLAAAGYPGDYPTGMPIEGIAAAECLGEIQVFQAGTRLDGGIPVASGGRVLCVTARRPDLDSARRTKDSLSPPRDNPRHTGQPLHHRASPLFAGTTSGVTGTAPVRGASLRHSWDNPLGMKLYLVTRAGKGRQGLTEQTVRDKWAVQPRLGGRKLFPMPGRNWGRG
jgi:phosphoribosylamine--glycine ligase